MHTHVTEHSASAASSHAYARTGPRIRAGLTDTAILFCCFTLFALALGVLHIHDRYSRLVWLTFLLALILYEPFLVALRGATVGHRIHNIYVADARTGHSIGFVRALLRFMIKSALGVFSLVSMLVTRRRLALHDVFTRSEVRIRDLTRTARSQYSFEGDMPIVVGTPSVTRRILVILGYCLLVYVGLSVFAALSMSPRCLMQSECHSSGDRTATTIVGVGLWVLFAVVIVLGWRGKLYGCRIRSVADTDSGNGA